MYLLFFPIVRSVSLLYLQKLPELMKITIALSCEFCRSKAQNFSLEKLLEGFLLKTVSTDIKGSINLERIGYTKLLFRLVYAPSMQLSFSSLQDISLEISKRVQPETLFDSPKAKMISRTWEDAQTTLDSNLHLIE